MVARAQLAALSVVLTVSQPWIDLSSLLGAVAIVSFDIYVYVGVQPVNNVAEKEFEQTAATASHGK